MSLPYTHYKNRPKKLTVAFAKQEYKKIINQIDAAEKSSSPSKWIKLIREWNSLGAYIMGEYSRAYYELARDVRIEKNQKKELFYSQKLLPAITELEHKIIKSLHSSKHKAGIGKLFGDRYLTLNEMAYQSFDPRNIELNMKISQLENKYEKLANSAMVTINNEKMTLFATRKLSGSENENTRKSAYIARTSWITENAPKIEKIFSQMMKLRIKMAKNAGFEDYITMRYHTMGRTDYDKNDVAKFRDASKKYLVPLRKQMYLKLKSDLKKDRLRPWDVAYNSLIFNPLAHVPDDALSIEDQLQKSGELFERLSPRLSKHFSFMVKNNLIDLEEREGKKKPGFMTDFPDQDLYVILCNSVGNSDDVRTITHEMGHAFQGYESRAIELIDMRSPTAELAEVHSMGMEFLSLPLIDIYFSKKYAKKFELGHWWEAVDTILYVCAVDELQHWFYENPSAKPGDWHKKWLELIEIYLPGADDRGFKQQQSLRWLMQSHIINSPFYFIDYALAQICAMQLGMIDAKDHKKAMNIYLKLCKLGGTKSFLEALKYAGLESPFQEETIKKTAKFAAKKLSIKPVL